VPTRIPHILEGGQRMGAQIGRKTLYLGIVGGTLGRAGSSVPLSRGSPWRF